MRRGRGSYHIQSSPPRKDFRRPTQYHHPSSSPPKHFHPKLFHEFSVEIYTPGKEISTPKEFDDRYDTQWEEDRVANPENGPFYRLNYMVAFFRDGMAVMEHLYRNKDIKETVFQEFTDRLSIRYLRMLFEHVIPMVSSTYKDNSRHLILEESIPFPRSVMSQHHSILRSKIYSSLPILGELAVHAAKYIPEQGKKKEDEWILSDDAIQFNVGESLFRADLLFIVALCLHDICDDDDNKPRTLNLLTRIRKDKYIGSEALRLANYFSYGHWIQFIDKVGSPEADKLYMTFFHDFNFSDEKSPSELMKSLASLSQKSTASQMLPLLPRVIVGMYNCETMKDSVGKIVTPLVFSTAPFPDRILLPVLIYISSQKGPFADDDDKRVSFYDERTRLHALLSSSTKLLFGEIVLSCDGFKLTY